MHPIFSLMRLSVGLLAAAATRARVEPVLHCGAIAAARPLSRAPPRQRPAPRHAP